MKKQCKNCQKRRDEKFFDTPRSLNCQMCKIALKAGIKREKRELSSKTWIKRLDDLVGSRVRARGTCEAEGRNHKGPLQWAHIVSRSYHNTRWDEDNALCLCAGCHKYFTDRPLEWEMLIVQRLLGSTKLRKIKIKALSHAKVNYKELYESLL